MQINSTNMNLPNINITFVLLSFFIFIPVPILILTVGLVTIVLRRPRNVPRLLLPFSFESAQPIYPFF